MFWPFIQEFWVWEYTSVFIMLENFHMLTHLYCLVIGFHENCKRKNIVMATNEMAKYSYNQFSCISPVELEISTHGWIALKKGYHQLFLKLIEDTKDNSHVDSPILFSDRVPWKLKRKTKDMTTNEMAKYSYNQFICISPVELGISTHDWIALNEGLSSVIINRKDTFF